MDLVDVDDVADSLARFGESYLTRVFTEREVAACAGGTDIRRLAACFAAKEATLKTLGARDEPVDWRSIEVVVPREGDATAVLSGRSAELAARERIVRFEVSVTTARAYAAAVVLAEGAGATKPAGEA